MQIKLEITHRVQEGFDSAPYGWPVENGSALAESLQQALEHVMSTGEYRTIANVWGVEKGMIDKSVITARSGDSMAALLRSVYR
jgi:hypothetical protein